MKAGAAGQTFQSLSLSQDISVLAEHSAEMLVTAWCDHSVSTEGSVSIHVQLFQREQGAQCLEALWTQEALLGRGNNQDFCPEAVQELLLFHTDQV